MYSVECLENRARVFKDGVEYIEMDVTTTCDNFLETHEELFNIIPQLDDKTKEKILSIYNADFRGKQYRLNKVGELVKNDKGQLSLW